MKTKEPSYLSMADTALEATFVIVGGDCLFGGQSHHFVPGLCVRMEWGGNQLGVVFSGDGYECQRVVQNNTDGLWSG